MNKINYKCILEKSIIEHLKMISLIQGSKVGACRLSKLILATLKQNGIIYFIGNGGSASDCQHIVAEFVGRFKLNRLGYRAVSLVDNIATLTAVSNDFSYEKVFLRQVSTLVTKNDLIIAISTSGKSKNILNVLSWSKKQKVKSVLITGKATKNTNTNLTVNIPSIETERIQEGYMLILHSICEYIELELT